MPARGLVYHEWSAHGTCSGLEPAEYFSLVRRAYSSIKIPQELSRPQPGYRRAARSGRRRVPARESAASARVGGGELHGRGHTAPSRSSYLCCPRSDAASLLRRRHARRLQSAATDHSAGSLATLCKGRQRADSGASTCRYGLSAIEPLGSIPGRKSMSNESAIRREVGAIALMFTGLGSIIGSGWLFGAWRAAQLGRPGCGLCLDHRCGGDLVRRVHLCRARRHVPGVRRRGALRALFARLAGRFRRRLGGLDRHRLGDSGGGRGLGAVHELMALGVGAGSCTCMPPTDRES